MRFIRTKQFLECNADRHVIRMAEEGPEAKFCRCGSYINWRAVETAPIEKKDSFL